MNHKIWNVPNVLTMIRFLLVPVAIIFFFETSVPYHLWIAGGVVILAYITDVCDGYIARKHDLVTDFGKIADPAADKFMQLSLLICLSITYPIVIPALAFMLLKDLSMAIGATILYKKGKVISANWFGKVASFITLASILLILVFPMDKTIMTALIALTVLANLVAIIAYIVQFSEILRQKKQAGK